MQKRVTLMIVLALLISGVALGQDRCRRTAEVKDPPGLDEAQRNWSWVVYTDQTYPAYFYVPERRVELRPGFLGRLCGQDAMPLANQPVVLIRVTAEGSMSGEAPTLADLSSGALHEEDRFVTKTEENGLFTVTNLKPGRYLLYPDWEELPTGSSMVMFDIEWVPPLDLLAPVHKASTAPAPVVRGLSAVDKGSSR